VVAVVAPAAAAVAVGGHALGAVAAAHAHDVAAVPAAVALSRCCRLLLPLPSAAPASNDVAGVMAPADAVAVIGLSLLRLLVSLPLICLLWLHWPLRWLWLAPLLPLASAAAAEHWDLAPNNTVY
jgi:hypothetical protein